jgi:hypothetical protein
MLLSIPRSPTLPIFRDISVALGYPRCALAIEVKESIILSNVAVSSAPTCKNKYVLDVSKNKSNKGHKLVSDAKGKKESLYFLI